MVVIAKDLGEIEMNLGEITRWRELRDEVISRRPSI